MLNNNYGMKKELNFLILVVLIVLLVREIVIARKKWYYKAMAIILVVVFPLALMSITVAASSVNIYDTTGVIMLPTMNYVYVFVVVFLNRINIREDKSYYLRWCGLGILFAMAVSMLNFCMTAQTYQKHNMKKMDYLSKSIVYDVEQLIDGSQDYMLCFIGKVENGNYPEQYPQLLDSLHWVTASYGTVWEDFLGTQECWRSYISQNLGKHYNRCSNEQYDEIVASEFFGNMNSYPDTNSISIYNDEIIVIKLSEVEN